MANKVPNNPMLTGLAGGTTFGTMGPYTAWAGNIRRDLMQVLGEHARLLNRAYLVDGTEPLTAPLVLPSYAVADAPAVADHTGGMIFVTDEVGGPTVAYSDGTNWRRVYDNAVITT